MNRYAVLRMFADLSPHIITSLSAASILGALVGLEREIHGRPAGFRTHLLVSLGSCLFVLTSIQFYKTFGNFSGTMPVGTDPGRIAAQVVTGIGFLGAGAIIRDGTSVRGLTTAACLWVVAAVGVACGIGMYGTALIVTLLAVISLMLLKKIEGFIKKDVYLTIRVWSVDMHDLLPQLEQVLKECSVALVDVSVERNVAESSIYYELETRHRNRDVSCDLIRQMGDIQGIKKVSIH
jgi:putative Mg2+ transporter-C (MgtC) family protein